MCCRRRGCRRTGCRRSLPHSSSRTPPPAVRAAIRAAVRAAVAASWPAEGCPAVGAAGVAGTAVAAGPIAAVRAAEAAGVPRPGLGLRECRAGAGGRGHSGVCAARESVSAERPDAPAQSQQGPRPTWGALPGLGSRVCSCAAGSASRPLPGLGRRGLGCTGDQGSGAEVDGGAAGPETG